LLAKGCCAAVAETQDSAKSENKDFKRDYAKEKLKKTWDSVSLRTETLKKGFKE
jgi:hypothetical protein